MGGFGGLLLCVLAGFGAVRAVWPAPRKWSGHDGLRLALAPALGLGLLSFIFFGVRTVLGLSAGTAGGAFAGLAVGLMGLAWWRAGGAEPEIWVERKAPVWLWILFGVVAAIGLGSLMLFVAIAPHGEWDAWSIWNMRARFLFRAEEPGGPFSAAMDWSHLDYPLLIPASVAGIWTFNGAEAQWLAAAVTTSFWISAVMVPVLAVARLRGTVLGLTAGIALAGTPLLARNAGAMYADVPLAYFIGAAVALGLLAIDLKPGWPLAALAGFHAGLAAWTKNEGLMFCGVLVLTFCLAVRSRDEFRARLRLVGPLLIGMAVALAVVGHFKYHLAPANDLMAAGKASVGARLTDFSRYSATFWGIVEGLLTFGGWLLTPVIVMGVWLAVQGVRKVESGAMFWPLAVAAVQLTGYLAVFVLGADRLDWHLEGAVNRLLLQIWPATVIGLMLVARESSATESR